MNFKAYYKCSCGIVYFSDHPYNELHCSNCQKPVPRLFKIADIPAIDEGTIKSPEEFKKISIQKGYTGKLKHPNIEGNTYRPYILGFGCDGSTDRNIHFIAQKLLFMFSIDYLALNNQAYPHENNSWFKNDFAKMKDEASNAVLVPDATLIPENSTIQNLLDDLYSINFRSLVDEIEKVLEEKNISPALKFSDLLNGY